MKATKLILRFLLRGMTPNWMDCLPNGYQEFYKFMTTCGEKTLIRHSSTVHIAFEKLILDFTLFRCRPRYRHHVWSLYTFQTNHFNSRTKTKQKLETLYVMTYVTSISFASKFQYYSTSIVPVKKCVCLMLDYVFRLEALLVYGAWINSLADTSVLDIRPRRCFLSYYFQCCQIQYPFTASIWCILWLCFVQHCILWCIRCRYKNWSKFSRVL